jgi:Tol biopolymer transport system component/DNA-binding winged helix-turn-helix (wHTH) protein
MNLHVSIAAAVGHRLDEANLRLRVGEHIVDFGSLKIVTRPESSRLTGKSAAVLMELARHAGNTVTRDELLDRIWKGRCPTPDVLTQAITELRCALADDSKSPHYIETTPKVGYRLIAPVLVLDGPVGSVFSDAVEPAHEPASAALVSHSADAVLAPSARSRFPVFALICLFGIAAASIALAFVNHRQLPAKRSETSWRATGMRTLTSYPGAECRPHISPDGTRIAFGIVDVQSGLDRIVVRSIEPSQLVHLTSGTNREEGTPVWSPDGAQIAFERAGSNACTMFVASSLGGDEHEVGKCRNSYVNYYDWTPGGQGLITAEARQGRGLALIKWDLGTGAKTFLPYERSATDQDLAPRYSPDGRAIAFRRGIVPYSDLFVVPADGGAAHQVTHMAARIHGYAWSRDSRSLIFASDYEGRFALYVADIESRHVQALGVEPAEYPDTARANDAVVYEIPRMSNKLAEIGLEPDATPQLLAPSTGSDYEAELSPSGDRVVFVSDRTGQRQLWLHDQAEGITSQLTESGASFSSPHWNADGDHVLAMRHDSAGRQLVEIDATSRRQRVLSRADENVLLGMYGLDPDSYLLLIGTSGTDNRFVLLRHAGKNDETRRTLANNIADVQIDSSTRSIYYTPTAGSGLFRSDADGGNAHLLTTKVNPVSMKSWRIVDGRVWYVSSMYINPVALHEFDLASGQDRVLAALRIALQDVNFSVTPNRKSLVVALLGADDTDVGMFHLTSTIAR